MVKVITYGTYDLLHEGHLRLLRRAKALGDYLIVGITGDGFDLTRGKINVRQSLMERIEAVKATGLADQIIVEEYEGQKIDDIRRYEADIFTVGSDWRGHFDYLNEYCKVIYLDRTEGISSSEIRALGSDIKIGLVGESPILNKFLRESRKVNGVSISGFFTLDARFAGPELSDPSLRYDSYESLLDDSDAVYIISRPELHYSQIHEALSKGKHVLCESPVTMTVEEFDILNRLAAEKNLVLMDGIKTAYSTAFNRLILLVKSGIIGDIVSIDVTCTSLNVRENEENPFLWNSMTFWSTTGMLPVFDLLGTSWESHQIISRFMEGAERFDLFSNILFIYPKAVASVKIGQGVKSEGEMVISGTKGYVYVPAPWWKTDYFEVRFENPADNKRFFYQLEGEGIRFEILSFVKQIGGHANHSYISTEVSREMIRIIEDFNKGHVISI